MQSHENNPGISGVLKYITFGMIFFMWGFLTVLNLAVEDHLKKVFDLSYSINELINMTFFATYLVVSLVAGLIINRLGYKSAIILGWTLAILGCLGFFAAINIRLFPFFMTSLVIQAAGITILQVSVNLYVVLWRTVKVKIKTAASRLVLLQAFNSLGAFLAPFLTETILLAKVPVPMQDLKNLAKEDRFDIEWPYVQYPFLYLAIIMSLYLIYLFYARIPKISMTDQEPLNDLSHIRRVHVMHFPQLRLGAFAIFAYVGAEVALSRYLHDFAPDNPQYYWGGALLGRFIGALILLYVSPRKAVCFCASVAASLVIISVFTTGSISFWAVTAVGLFNGILFPSIFTLGVNGLGKFSENGSAVLIMSIVGGAVIPFNVRNFSYVSYKLAFIIIIICYAYIALYGIKLSRYKRRANVADSLA